MAIVGAGWAGLAAAVRAVRQGHRTTLFEMAHQPGGRARSVQTPRAEDLDNGQHILIGAYVRTLALMRTVGAEPDLLLQRQPLSLLYPDGRGLRLPAGAAMPAFVRGVLAASHWTWTDRLRLLAAAAGWRLVGFTARPQQTVADLCRGLPAGVVRDLMDPLCVAALNTPMASASATVFLRVLRDALFSGPGSADLLLPRRGLSELLPTPARQWLARHGADIHPGRRVMALQRQDGGWSVDGLGVDDVVLACSAVEAARLAAPWNAEWAKVTAALRYEPIVTAYLHAPELQLPTPMLALRADEVQPAQFVFDLGALGRSEGLFAFVVSGASSWTERGLAATGTAVLRQARMAFPGAFEGDDAKVLMHVAAEQRATFACTPALVRPPATIAHGLVAAGDYVAGPYPATLEGAVRAGEAAIDLIGCPG